jgi:hypothetical protein
MVLFAQANAVTLASDELYMSAKQLQHCMRASKNAKGLVVDDIELIGLKLVNFITATRRTDKKEFNGKRYIKIK